MADKKISGLTILEETPAANDLIQVVDKSDQTMASTGTNKRVTREKLIGTITESEGGTGETTYSNGQVLIGNASGGLTKTTLTGGTGISVTEGDGSITIAETISTDIEALIQPKMTSLADDTTPQLGGELDVNGNSIISEAGGDIAITPDSSGKVVLDGINWPTTDGTSGQVIQTDGTGNLSFTDNTGSGGGGGSTNSFATISLSANGGSASGDASIAADSSTDTLALKAGAGMTLTGDSSNDAVTISRDTVSLTADVSGTLPVANGGTGLTAITTLLNSNTTASDVGLGSVENTAVSTWAGSSNVTTLGTVGTGTWQGTAIGDSYISSASTWNGKQSALTFGIANTNAVQINSADVADDEYARFTATGLESRSGSEVLSDIGAAASAHNHDSAYAAASHNHDGVYEAADADIVKADTATNFTAPVRGGVDSTQASAGVCDLSEANNHAVAVSGTTSVSVTNPTAGQSGVITITHDGSAVSFSGIKFEGGSAPTPSTSGVDLLAYYVESASRVSAVLLKATA